MPRRGIQNKYLVCADAVYNSHIANMFIQQIMKQGKKRLAYRILSSCLSLISETTDESGVEVLRQAIFHVTPVVEVRPRRVGGSVYQVPVDVSPERGRSLAVRWIVQAARQRPGRGMVQKLAGEFIDASKHTGYAIRKREDMHRMAEANKAFAHFGS